MKKTNEDLSKAERQHRIKEAFACHAVEGSPATAEDIEMFEMFEREGWSHEQCRAYIFEQIRLERNADLAGDKIS